MLAAQIPLVPLNMTIKNSGANVIIVNVCALNFEVLVLSLFRVSDLEFRIFRHIVASTAGIPSSTNCGNECESGNKEKTLNDNCSPKYANHVLPSWTAILHHCSPNCRHCIPSPQILINL